jgi:hypothetical protein
MSYIQSRIRCDHCQFEMNVAFGIVGRTIIASWPEQCPKCGFEGFTEIAGKWQVDPVVPNVETEH